MIEHPLSVACQLLKVDKPHLQYWREQLDPNTERHGFNFGASLAYRVIVFLVNEAGYTVLNLKKFQFPFVFSQIETFANESDISRNFLILDYKHGRFKLVSTSEKNKLLNHSEFPLIDVGQLEQQLMSAFRFD